MVLYESHSVIHGRPWPLQGEYYANLFLHFEPLGYTTELEQKLRRSSDDHRTARDKFEAALKRSQQYAEDADDAQLPSSSFSTSKNRKHTGELPHYIKEGTVEADRWRQDFVFQRRNFESERLAAQKAGQLKLKKQESEMSVHIIAASGDLSKLKAVAESDPGAMDRADRNGWKPIHGEWLPTTCS